MIGGYLYNKLDEKIEMSLHGKFGNSFSKIKVWDNGYLFYNEPFRENQTPFLSSDDLIVLSQDFLVAEDSDGEYRELNLQKDFPEMFRKQGSDAFKAIASDFRMIIVAQDGAQKTLFLVSNRAGSGRMYYHLIDTGILFCSDLRFLLTIVSFEVNNIGIYSILKYGAVPEPMTINNNISAIPAAHYIKYDLNYNDYSIIPYFKFGFTYGNTFPSIAAISGQNLLAQTLQLVVIEGQSAEEGVATGQEWMEEAIE